MWGICGAFVGHLWDIMIEKGIHCVLHQSECGLGFRENISRPRLDSSADPRPDRSFSTAIIIDRDPEYYFLVPGPFYPSCSHLHASA